jgi:uncharacterized protein
MTLRLGLLSAACLLLFASAGAAERLQIGWADLIPAGQEVPVSQKIGPAPTAATREVPLAGQLSGKTVELSGYLLPADREDDLVYAFMLVPTRGACSHMEQPPPSQVVYVFPEKPYRLSMNYEPVSVSGTISLGLEKTQLFILDGVAVIESGYKIRNARVEKWDLPSAPPISPWSFLENHPPGQTGGQAAVPAGSLSSTR